MMPDNVAELEELQGDTLTTAEAEQYVHAISHEGCTKENCVTSFLRGSSSPAVNQQARQAIPKDANHPVHGACFDEDSSETMPLRVRSSSASNRQARQALPQDENRENDGAPQVLTGDESTASNAPNSFRTSPRRFKIRSGRPKLKGFAIYEDQPDLQTPTDKARKSVTLPRPSKLLESNAESKSEASMVGVARSGSEASRYYGTLPLTRQALTRSSNSLASVTTVVNLADDSGPSTPSEPCVDDPNAAAAAQSCIVPQRELLEVAFSSAVESPRIWVNGTDEVEDANDKLSEPRSMLDLAAAKYPTTAAASDGLYVYFPSQMCPGTYSVEIDLEVLLSSPDYLGWQIFKIQGLPVQLDSDVRGSFQFQLKPRSDHDAPLPPVQFETSQFPIVQDVQGGHIEGDFSVSEPFSLRLRLQSEVRHIQKWNSNVSIDSSLSLTEGRGICMRNCANLTIEPAGEDTFARRVTFSVLVRNGPPSGGIYRLQSGQNSVRLSAYEHTVTDLDRTVEIWIERDHQDMESPLRLEFTCLYPSVQDISILMPVLFPKFGNVLSEKIWIFKPLPPLIVHPVIRKFLSTWTFSEHTIGSREVLCFQRMEMPPRYPNALSDDAVIRLRSHNTVSFVGLEVPDNFGQVEKCSNIIPSLDYIVDIVPQNRLECRMMFDLEVGTHQQLLRIDALEWVPKTSLINGRLCSQEQPCWWEEEDQLCLFKAPWMTPGTILQIKMAFTMIGRVDDFATERDQFTVVEVILPRTTDKVVLGGDLVCNIDDAVMTLVSNKDNIDDEAIPFSTRCGGKTKRLSLLPLGHKIELRFMLPNPIWRHSSKKPESSTRADRIRFSEGIPLQPRTLRFDDELLGSSSSSDGSDSSSDAEERLSNDIEAPISVGTLNDIDPDINTSDNSSNPDPATAYKDVREHWSHQLWGSDASSISSNEDEAAEKDEDNEGEDRGPGWFWDGILFAFNTCVNVANIPNAAYRRLDHITSMRFRMRYLVLVLVCISLKNFPTTEITLSAVQDIPVAGKYTEHEVEVPVRLGEENDEMVGEEMVGQEARKEDTVERRTLRDTIDMWLGWRPVRD
ncbi:MAG: hypothetical protein Q9226_000675 [Calogaya cf. arnoldii]